MGITVEHCLAAACVVAGVSTDQMRADRRTKALVLTRQVGMKVASDLTGRSDGVVGRGFNRDRSVVGHSRATINRRLSDPKVQECVDRVTRLAKQSAGEPVDVKERPLQEAPECVPGAVPLPHWSKVYPFTEPHKCKPNKPTKGPRPLINGKKFKAEHAPPFRHNGATIRMGSADPGAAVAFAKLFRETLESRPYA